MTDSAAPLRYRAGYADTDGYTPLEPTHLTVPDAQQACEAHLHRGRAELGDHGPLTITWQHDLLADGPRWQMLVATPRLIRPVHLGYEIVVADSALDPVGPTAPSVATG
ncbi:hypothetical protein [Nocardia altamirensis]|uniref:hypothetical protein n=1 Tax=Nocardia altamirensis TaxID=472158 RepID=UPI00083FF0E9|nr:hypothetical protein [Nocardia altamirensis]